MSDTLLIHYNIEQPQQATWSLCNDAGELTGKITTSSLDEISELAGKHPVIVLLNSQCLHINQVKLPTQNLQKMLKAVPYAIEEFIADDIENFHFVISKNKNSDVTSVVGIEKNTLLNIVQIFEKANINVEKIIPDAVCLAANETQWACLNYLNSTYLQTDTLNGLILPSEILQYTLTNRLADQTQNTPDKILLFSEQENNEALNTLSFEETSDDTEIEKINIVYNTHPLVVFCGHYKHAASLNLLQHEFKPKRKSSGYWQHWKLAASIAVIWLVLNLGIATFKHSQLKDENIVAKAQIEKLYKKSFPKSRKIVNPRVQMEQKLKELKIGANNSGNGLIFLLAESFGTSDPNKQKNITLQSLTFRNNRMDIGLDSTNLQSIENLNKKLNSNKNIMSEITSSSSEKDKVKGNIRIEGRS
jgi:general secretion pathway protein L